MKSYGIMTLLCSQPGNPERGIISVTLKLFDIYPRGPDPRDRDLQGSPGTFPLMAQVRLLGLSF